MLCKVTGYDCDDIKGCGDAHMVYQDFISLSEKREIGAEGNKKKAFILAKHIIEKSCLFDNKQAKCNFIKAVLYRDIGKLGVDEEILNSKETFDDSDPRWKNIKNHPEHSISMLRKPKNSCSPDVLEIIRNHHPWYLSEWDGFLIKDVWDELTTGYTVVSIIDSYVGLRSQRARRKAISHDEAFEILKSELYQRKYSAGIFLQVWNVIKDVCKSV